MTVMAVAEASAGVAAARLLLLSTVLDVAAGSSAVEPTAPAFAELVEAALDSSFLRALPFLPVRAGAEALADFLFALDFFSFNGEASSSFSEGLVLAGDVSLEPVERQASQNQSSSLCKSSSEITAHEAWKA